MLYKLCYDDICFRSVDSLKFRANQRLAKFIYFFQEELLLF